MRAVTIATADYLVVHMNIISNTKPISVSYSQAVHKQWAASLLVPARDTNTVGYELSSECTDLSSFPAEAQHWLGCPQPLLCHCWRVSSIASVLVPQAPLVG